MKPPPFAYEVAPDVRGAVELLSHYGDDGKVLAGGQSLVPLLNFRLVRPSVLIDINGLGELDFVHLDQSVIRIGALVRHVRLEKSAEVAEHARLLVEAVLHVGHPQIRNRGTIGGSVAHADPAGELLAALCALEARFRVRSVSRERTINWQDFFVGPLTTALAADELLTEIEVPRPAPRSGYGFCEFARRTGDFALGGAAVVVALDANGGCSAAAIGLLSAGATPVRASAAETVLVGAPINERVIQEAADEAVKTISPPADVHGGSAFRRRVIRELVSRALLQAATDAQEATQ